MSGESIGDTKHSDDNMYTEYRKTFMYIITEKVKQIQQVAQTLTGTSLQSFGCPLLKTSLIKGKFVKI